MKKSRNNLVITLTITFVLMSLLVIFTSRVIFRTAFSSVQELGENKATAITADLENYLDTAKSVLWVAADSVDHMVANGATDEEIVEYITRESTNTEQQFDESYTGIYGVIRGNYVDGVGWVPPKDYDPTMRDWYKTTVGGKGDVVIVSPYVDAQTGNVIISVGRALSDNNNALALDLTLSGVQEIVEDIQINGYGYGYVVNNDGMVIAHPDKSQNGQNYSEIPEQKEFFQKVAETGKGTFNTKIDGEKCTVFVDTVMDQWYLVIITKNADLYRAPKYLLIISTVITLLVFVLLSVFYLLGYRNQRITNEKMEQMKDIERKKDYEAKILKLEKSAADSANKAKSNFLADMSHEIRTPINAVLGMNEMILHEAKDEEILDYAASIKSAGTTLLSIINSILDFSKIEDGRMRLVPVEFETVDLINGLVNSISERARTKELEFKVDVDETTPSIILGDDVRISQIIMNLLTNAVKYTEKGSILFSVKNLGVTQGQGTLRISVKDTGIGIRKEDIDKLAVSFERVDEKRNRHIEGTGLGISIVTKLLEMMGSKLQIKSEYGVGSEFYFELPVEVEDETPIGNYSMNNRGVSRNTGSAIMIKAPGAKVLLTDDNDMNRKVAANLLKLFDIEPTLCRSGKETIALMMKEKYDIVFLDHMMPDMDGIETLGFLKEGNLVGETKVIALTANAVVGAKEMYLDAGFDDYLSKPIDIPDLEKMLKKHLPEEIVQHFSDTPDTNEEKTPAVLFEEEAKEEFVAEGKIDALRKLGLLVDEGLTYCGGDEDFYVEIIDDYAKAAGEKIAGLTDFLAAGNLKDYKILVHSVKSASKTIGAMDLFEKTKALEFASGEENKEYVKENHEIVMEQYRQLAEKLKAIVEG